MACFEPPNHTSLLATPESLDKTVRGSPSSPYINDACGDHSSPNHHPEKPNHTSPDTTPKLPFTGGSFSLSLCFIFIYLWLQRENLYWALSNMAGTGVFAEILDGDVYKYYSDGEWKKSSSAKSVSIVNPTTRKTQYKVQGNQLSRM